VEDAMSEEKRDEQREVEDEPVEDMDVDPTTGEDVRGGDAVRLSNKVKTADKHFKAVSDFIRG
jgi:hypothetical protein